MSQEENKAIVRTYMEQVWNQQNMKAVDEFVADDFVQHIGSVEQGRQGIQQFFALIHQASSNIRNDIEDCLAEDDKVCVRATITATHTGPFLGVPATGRMLRFGAISILRIDQGKFVEGWGEQDMLGLMRQLGADSISQR
jgi:steroid delta-isomerase-like uncharacterized protein